MELTTSVLTNKLVIHLPSNKGSVK